MTLILAPGLALVAWVHYAAPLSDSFRKSYRQFLRWNDELPFVKFTLSEDERPMLSAELPLEALDRDALGLMIARLLAVCDLLLDESLHWLWPVGRRPKEDAERVSRNADFIERFAHRLGELSTSAPIETEAGRP